jgi:hypothetical protein
MEQGMMDNVDTGGVLATSKPFLDKISNSSFSGSISPGGKKEFVFNISVKILTGLEKLMKLTVSATEDKSKVSQLETCPSGIFGEIPLLFLASVFYYIPYRLSYYGGVNSQTTNCFWLVSSTLASLSWEIFFSRVGIWV